MRYFLVNNDYHLSDLASMNLKKRVDDTLIKIPHSISSNLQGLDFDKIFEFPFFYLGLRSLFDYSKIKQIHKYIDQELVISCADVLFVYTDNEILNQYIISKFYKNKCKVYMFEDGLATALVYNLVPRKLPAKELIKLFILRHFYGYSFTSVLCENKNYYPVINEKYITSIFFYLETHIKRNIETKYLKNNIKKLPNLNSNLAIFLNQDTYHFDQSVESYFEDLSYLFLKISDNFEKIVFKFHPREDVDFKNKIKRHLSLYKNIIYIDTTESVESIISKYSPKYAISYYSSALKNLFFFGIEPIFIYHLLDSINRNDFSVILNDYLKNLNYNFPKTIDDIKTGFHSGLSIPKASSYIEELI